MFKRLVLASILALSFGSSIAAEKYEIDNSHTQVQFTYSHMGFSNITGRFDTVTGEFLFDAADPSKSTIAITIPVKSLSTGVEKLDGHLLSADFFDAEKFPDATFKSSAVTAAGEGKLSVAGDLTIHGVTKPVTLAVTINKIGEHPMAKVPSAGFDANASIKRSDFGVGAYVPVVGDDLAIRITLEARKPKVEAKP